MQGMFSLLAAFYTLHAYTERNYPSFTPYGPSSMPLGYPSFPPFQLGQPRYPQDTFVGRYLHFIDVVDPSTLFHTKEGLESSVALLERWKKGERGFATDEQLWRAQKLKQAVLHPDTGEKIFAPFRMSGYVPFGWITVTGMLIPNPSTPTLLFWQWANQSHNALVNYANRNATQPQPMTKYLGAYAAAVTAACSVSFGLTKLVNTFNFLPEGTRGLLKRFVPLPATSLASSLNVLCMRSSEVQSGIDVYDRDGNVIGVSKEAAKQALKETTMTRAFLPIPLLALPPLVLPSLERRAWVKASAVRTILVQATVCTLAFAFSLPIALALFPQESKISTSKLEDSIRQKTQSEYLYFNKGL